MTTIELVLAGDRNVCPHRVHWLIRVVDDDGVRVGKR